MSKYINKKALLSSLSDKDIIKVCCDLGGTDYKKDTQGNLCFSTALCHGGDSPYKLIYYPNHEDKTRSYGLFHCYTCSDSYDLVELVIRANRVKHKTVTYFQALNYIAQITGHNASDFEEPLNKYLIDDWEFINKFRRHNKKDVPVLRGVNEHILEMFDYTPHEDFLNDHISSEVLSQFEISYWGATNQIVIPHRDLNSRLIGIRGRYLDPDDVNTIGKYVPLTVEGQFLSHALGNNLYGIHINQDKIKACKKCLLLEGEKGVMQNHTYFGDDDYSLAVCGSNISNTQIKLLLQYLQVEEIIIGFDKMFHENETFEEEIYRNKIFKKIEKIIPYCRVCLLWDKEGLVEYKQSPTDYGKNTLLKLLDQKIEITMEDINDTLKKE